MSNVTSLASRQHLKLDKLEAEVLSLCQKQQALGHRIGLKLLEIADSGEWAAGKTSSFTDYLEGLSARLLREGVNLAARNLRGYYHAAEFDRKIAGQKLRAAERAAIDAASPEAKKEFTRLVRQVIKDAPAPINEAQAVRQLVDDGYWDPKTEPITMRKSRAVIQARGRDQDPTKLAFQLTDRLNAAIEIIEGYSDLGDARLDPDLRFAARTLVRLLTKLLEK